MRQWFKTYWRGALIVFSMLVIVWIVLEMTFYVLVTEPINRYYFPGTS